jgi:hypothetical protein
MDMDQESAKISRKLTIQTGGEMTTYKFTPPTNEPDLLNYIEHAMTARIAVELRKGARVFIKATDESLLEITQTPNQKQKEKDKMWQVITEGNTTATATLRHNTNIKSYINDNHGVFYSMTPKTQTTVKTGENDPILE